MMQFASGGVVSIRPVDGGDWQEIGTLDSVPAFVDNGYMMPTSGMQMYGPAPWVKFSDEQIESYTSTISRTYSRKVEFNDVKLNRRVLDLLFGLNQPRTARSLRRRRAKLKRKRTMRKRTR